MACWKRHPEHEHGKIESLLIWKTEKHLKSATHLFSGFDTPLVFWGCLFIVAAEQFNLPSFGNTFPQKKSDKLRYWPQQHVFPKVFLWVGDFSGTWLANTGQRIIMEKAVVFCGLVVPCIMTYHGPVWPGDGGGEWGRKASKSWSVWGCWAQTWHGCNGECHPLDMIKVVWIFCLEALRRLGWPTRIGSNLDTKNRWTLQNVSPFNKYGYFGVSCSFLGVGHSTCKIGKIHQTEFEYW